METSETAALWDDVEFTGELSMSQLTEACGGSKPSREPSACTNMISLVHHSS